MMTMTETFHEVIDDVMARLKDAPLIHPPRWQSTDVSKNPNMATYELLNYSFTLLGVPEKVKDLQRCIAPNLPWAEDHFKLERVGGQPLNPGQEWRNWPYAGSAALHRREGQDDPQFDHSYAERYWPKAAGVTPGGILEHDVLKPHQGIRFDYGDLDDLVTTLAREPLTRQAYLPVWFPEDLDACVKKKRVPCSLGYHFIMRNNQLHIVYYLRSCDFVRHFRDDVYMTIRLMQWVLDQCRLANPEEGWWDIRPGSLTMHITSFHIFKADYPILFKEKP